MAVFAILAIYIQWRLVIVIAGDLMNLFTIIFQWFTGLMERERECSSHYNKTCFACLEMDMLHNCLSPLHQLSKTMPSV